MLGSSRLCHHSCIHHCSPFTSSVHNHPCLLYIYYSFIQHFFSHRSSVPIVAFLSTSHLSYQILQFSLPTGPLFSSCVQTTSTHCFACPAKSHNTVLFHLISHSVHTLLHTYSSDTSSPLHLISSTAIFYVSAFYSAVGTVYGFFLHLLMLFYNKDIFVNKRTNWNLYLGIKRKITPSFVVFIWLKITRATQYTTHNTNPYKYQYPKVQLEEKNFRKLSG